MFLKRSYIILIGIAHGHVVLGGRAEKKRRWEILTIKTTFLKKFINPLKKGHTLTQKNLIHIPL